MAIRGLSQDVEPLVGLPVLLSSRVLLTDRARVGAYSLRNLMRTVPTRTVTAVRDLCKVVCGTVRGFGLFVHIHL